MFRIAFFFALAACSGAAFDVSGQPYDATQDCWGDPELMGTTSQEDCDDALTFATSPDGTCTLFPNSCTPEEDDWTLGCTDTVNDDAPRCP